MRDSGPVKTSLRFTLAFTILVGCDAGTSQEESPGKADKPASNPASAPGETAKPEAAPVPPSDTPSVPDSSKNTFEVPSKDAALAAKAKVSAHLAAGRKAVKAKDYATGIAELGQAKDLGPMNAKVLGELGWAYFLDGQLGPAQHELEQALHYTAKAKTKGAVLYNLGRVHEARGDAQLAAELYGQSLRVRPNDTVQKRLASVRPNEAAAHPQCTIERQPSKPSAALCTDFLARHPHEGEDPPVCSMGADGQRTAPRIEEPSYTAEVFAVHDYELMEESFVLAVVVGDTWFTADVLSVFHPGVGYADENVDDITLEARELTGGGAKEIVMRWRVGQHDMDPGVMYQEDSVTKNVAVLSVDAGEDGTVRWLATVRTYAEWNSGDMDPDEWGAMANPETGKTSAKVTFDDKGSLTVTVDGETPPVSTVAGTFRLGDYPVLCPVEQDYFGL